MENNDRRSAMMLLRLQPELRKFCFNILIVLDAVPYWSTAGGTKPIVSTAFNNVSHQRMAFSLSGTKNGILRIGSSYSN